MSQTFLSQCVISSYSLNSYLDLLLQAGHLAVDAGSCTGEEKQTGKACREALNLTLGLQFRMWSIFCTIDKADQLRDMAVVPTGNVL
jgi:hypothetical protein